MENKPDFLVVGAAKSGTTSLFHYIDQHPSIYIPALKECRFFSQLPKNFNGLGAEFFPNSGITDEEEYFELFKGYEDKVCGDISNDYLYYYEGSIKNIKKYLSNDVKIVIILRNPIDRAYSNYMHASRDGWEDCSFEEALEKEESRIKNNWAWPYHYVKVGKYYNQVEAYLDNFENIKIYLFGDLKDKSDFFDNLFGFLEVDKINLEINERFNISGYPKNRKLQNFLNKKNIIKNIIKPFIPKSIREKIVKTLKNKNLEKIPMKQEIREKLKDIFKEEIEKLSKLINMDLSHWLK